MAVTTWCRADMGYVGPDGVGAPLRPVEVEIRDGRTTELPGWQVCGFERLDDPTAMRDWTDDDEIATVHYPEAEALARSLTGFGHALVADHVKRNAEDAGRRKREQTPVRLVHSDFSDDYDQHVRKNWHTVRGRGAAALARAGLTGDDVAGARRIVMLQLWRNLGAPRMDLPVAWCDARTVGRDEMVPFRYNGYVAGADAFDAVAIAEPTDPAQHGWYAFPELTVDEVVAFRTYDTEMVPAGTTYFTPHSAFRDPAVEPGAPARFSVELRLVCLDL
jgi:hypothetical protein